MRDDPRVDPIGLGQDTEGLCKRPHLARIDHDDGEAGRGQGGRHWPVVAARGLQDKQGGCQGLQLGHQGGDPGLVIGDLPRLGRRADSNIEAGLRDINANKTGLKGHCTLLVSYPTL